MPKPIYPCIWSNNQAKEIAAFYCSLFSHSHIITEMPFIVHLELDGFKCSIMNGGNRYKPNPSVSLFVTCETDAEIDALWGKLSEGGSVLMPVDKYEWSERYGWCTDKYGVSWQLYKGKLSDVGNQKIAPFLTFVGNQLGNAEAAAKWYTFLFQNSEIQGIAHYPKEIPQIGGMTMHAQFLLDGKVWMASDAAGEHLYGFDEGMSFVVECDTQTEIDFFWDNFTKEGQEGMCGWCKDKFGVSWQIIPADLGKWVSNPEKGQKVVAAFMQMKKFDIQTLLNV